MAHFEDGNTLRLHAKDLKGGRWQLHRGPIPTQVLEEFTVLNGTSVTKKIKVKVQLDVAKFWTPPKTPYEFLPELKNSTVDCVVQFAKIWTGVDQWGCTLELKHALVHESSLAACPF